MWFMTIGNIAVSAMLGSQLSKLAISLGVPSLPATLFGYPANLTRIAIGLTIFSAAFYVLHLAVRDDTKGATK